MKFTLSVLALFLTLLAGFAQGPRPPVSLLSQLSDVGISSPTDGQALVYSSGKWMNSFSLLDATVNNTSVMGGSAAADFASMTLIGKAGTILDWSGDGSPKLPFGIADSTGLLAIDFERRLYRNDGATVVFDWGGSSLRLPTLTTNGYLKTSGGDGTLIVDTTGTLGGNYVRGPLSSVPSGIPRWADDKGEDLVDSAWTSSGNNLVSVASVNNNSVNLNMWNQSNGNAAETDILLSNDEGSGKIALYGSGYTPSGIISGGDLEIRSSSSARNLVFSSNGRIRFSNDLGSTESFAITKVGFGGRTSVTTTVDQTATTETAHAVYTVPANSTAVGTTFRIVAWGTMDHGTTSITYIARLRWGGTSGVQLVALTIVGSTSTMTNADWKITALVTIRTTGATGGATAYIDAIDHAQGAIGLKTYDEVSSGGTPVSIDTTSSKDLDLTWTMSGTTGTPHVRTLGGAIEVVKP